MEPLFFKAENAASSGGTRLNPSASMEPLFFKAENLSARWGCLAKLPSFNGAAFFQSGK